MIFTQAFPRSHGRLLVLSLLLKLMFPLRFLPSSFFCIKPHSSPFSPSTLNISPPILLPPSSLSAISRISQTHRSLSPMAKDDPSGPSAPSMCGDSHYAPEAKPKVRIIHVVAPEVIKTDVENFRELVQSLTGKHCSNQKALRRIRKPGSIRKGPRRSKDGYVPGTSSPDSGRTVVKKEGLGMWNAETSRGFLNGFEHLDGYAQELVEFPLLPMDHHQASNSSSSSQGASHTPVL